MSNKKYLYGMRLRPLGIACQPKEGFVERRDDSSNLFWDIIVYNKELSNKEVDDYDLKFLGVEYDD